MSASISWILDKSAGGNNGKLHVYVDTGVLCGGLIRGDGEKKLVYVLEMINEVNVDQQFHGHLASLVTSVIEILN